ncbi:unnamed protein product [Sphenostylis stenocarpa]|uniref:Uncharacterized protein n=1 Tax=Sphenostylis stenocarpa TaxID=92480 RepID=A0AA86VQF1_9FABA|nr:unnamed protein product [Sphenostylis stenocarpa]
MNLPMMSLCFEGGLGRVAMLKGMECGKVVKMDDPDSCMCVESVVVMSLEYVEKAKPLLRGGVEIQTNLALVDHGKRPNVAVKTSKSHFYFH